MGIGKNRERLWARKVRREDYEFHVRVPVEQKDLAILALMSEIYLEHASCLKEFEELMEKNAIPIDQIN